MTSTTRSLQQSWNTAWASAPPASCQTLRNLNNAVAWGQTCVFAEEDGDPTPFDINTACMPWVTSGISPSPSAFYSPATACPDSWTPVATQMSASSQNDGDRWIDGEVGLQCCPNGMVGDGATGCRPGSSGSWPVVECGEADAEENEQRTYNGASWPASATPSIIALQLRYQPSDVGSANPTASSTSASETGAGGSEGSKDGGEGGGLSTGATAAIATVIPLVLIIGALAAFLLWRRKKNRKAALVAGKEHADEKAGRPSGSVTGTTHHAVAAGSDLKAPFATAPTSHHETPEWNVEMDATEAERQKLVGPYQSPISATSFQSPVSASTAGNPSDAAELGGVARLPRKPIAPVEIDSTEVRAEVGDAYIPYRPGSEQR
jgi:hypothetical protein